MKLGVLLIAGLLVLFGAVRSPIAQSPDDKAHGQWLEARYKEATSIRPGMTRADLMKLFMEDGGLSGGQARPYVLRSCFLIKIEVKFDKPYGFDSRSVPDNEFKIVEVSKPYLERMALD
jgi:hypothetical protein